MSGFVKTFRGLSFVQGNLDISKSCWLSWYQHWCRINIVLMLREWSVMGRQKSFWMPLVQQFKHKPSEGSFLQHLQTQKLLDIFTRVCYPWYGSHWFDSSVQSHFFCPAWYLRCFLTVKMVALAVLDIYNLSVMWMMVLDVVFLLHFITKYLNFIVLNCHLTRGPLKYWPKNIYNYKNHSYR